MVIRMQGSSPLISGSKWERGWAGLALPLGKDLISLSEQKGSDTLRESDVEQAAFERKVNWGRNYSNPKLCYPSLYVKLKERTARKRCSPSSVCHHVVISIIYTIFNRINFISNFFLYIKYHTIPLKLEKHATVGCWEQWFIPRNEPGHVQLYRNLHKRETLIIETH